MPDVPNASRRAAVPHLRDVTFPPIIKSNAACPNLTWDVVLMEPTMVRQPAPSFSGHNSRFGRFASKVVLSAFLFAGHLAWAESPPELGPAHASAKTGTEPKRTALHQPAKPPGWAPYIGAPTNDSPTRRAVHIPRRSTQTGIGRPETTPRAMSPAAQTNSENDVRLDQHAEQPEHTEQTAPRRWSEIISSPKRAPRRKVGLGLEAQIAQRLAFSQNRTQQANATRPIPRSLMQTVSQQQPAGDPFEIIEEAGALSIQMRRSRLLKTKTGVFRTAIVDPGICDVVQYTPNELSIIGRRVGSTHVTFWFTGGDRDPMTYLIQVTPDTAARNDVQRRYDDLESLLSELFPDSKVRLTGVADKLIVRGQAKGATEAAQIMSIVRSSAGQRGGGARIGQGQAARVLSGAQAGDVNPLGLQLINMLRIPGVQQVALRVKIAELNRSAARGIGLNLDANIEINGNEGAMILNSILNTGGSAPALLGQIDNKDIEIGLRWLQQHGVIRLVSEPTLVTLSGHSATFVAGGEFAVPTVVGTGGLSAVTTDFRAFGAIISFLPTVVDKDRIRLQVSPEFSQIESSLTVNDSPGLKVRSVTTTVEMREGQTLAIAGLLDESMTASGQSNLPWLERIIGKRDTAREETELIILVTPELIHPMEPEEVPPLPGFDVTEPTNKEFFYHGRLEGNPTREYRSTVWPRLRRRYGAGGSSMISGPFGHGQ